MDENTGKHVFEVAQSIQEQVREIAPQEQPPPRWVHLYDQLVSDEELRDSTRDLYMDGHFALSVLKAYTCVNNVVKRRTEDRREGRDGAKLMHWAFSVDNPTLSLNELDTESEENQQRGYMEIFAGCIIGIRNPRAHEHQYMDHPKIALEMLSWANHLIRLARQADLEDE